MQKRDVKLRQLQAAMEAAMADRDQISGELERVLTVSDTAAGRKQVCTYEKTQFPHLSLIPLSPYRPGGAAGRRDAL